MTGQPAQLADLRRQLRQRAGEFLQRFYRHEILVARAVRGVQLEAVQRFRSEVADPLVRDIAGRLATFDARGHDVTPQSHPELEAIIREAEAIVERGVLSVQALARERMRDIGEGEAEFVQKNAERTTEGEPVPRAQIDQAVERPFLGNDVERWFQKMLTGPTGDTVRQRITQGVQEGRTVDEIVRSIRGTRTQRGVLDASRDAVAALVRTASTAAAAQARFEAFRALGITHWRFVATLDSRTSLQCAANDGKVFPVGEGPLPPLHPNCRSVAIPDLGEEPEGTRASVDGQVDAAMTFEAWLRSRPFAEQNELLGQAKAAAWRAGRLSLSDMLGRDLEPLTLAELRSLDRL